MGLMMDKMLSGTCDQCELERNDLNEHTKRDII